MFLDLVLQEFELSDLDVGPPAEKKITKCFVAEVNGNRIFHVTFRNGCILGSRY